MKNMKAVLNVKTDVAVKRSAQRVAAGFGLSLSAVVNAYLKQLVRDREIHLTQTPRMSPELEQELAEVEEDIKHRRNLSPGLVGSAAIRDYLSRL